MSNFEDISEFISTRFTQLQDFTSFDFKERNVKKQAALFKSINQIFRLKCMQERIFWVICKFNEFYALSMMKKVIWFLFHYAMRTSKWNNFSKLNSLKHFHVLCNLQWLHLDYIMNICCAIHSLLILGSFLSLEYFFCSLYKCNNWDF